MCSLASPGLAGKLLQAGPTFTTVVPHGCTCEDMKDTRNLPSHSVWGKPVKATAPGKKAWAITAINSVDKEQPISVALSSLGMGATSVVQETDVWTGKKSAVDSLAWHTLLPPGSHRFVLLEEQ